MNAATVPLKVAVLSFAHTHAEGYLSLLAAWPGIDLATSDPDGTPDEPGRGRPLADQLGVRYFDTYDEVFAWGPDAVVVCSENARHRPLVEQAARAGAHVLCEKPLATTLADGQAMVDACEAAGVALMIAYPVRFSPEFATLRELVRAGALGEILGITGANNGKRPSGRPWFVDPELSGGGALVDHIVHVADLVDVLLGEQARTVRAVTNQILHADAAEVRAETGGVVDVTYPGGVVLAVDCSWSQPEAAPTWGGLKLRVAGTAGTAEIDPFGAHIGGTTGAGAAWVGFASDCDSAMLGHFIDAVRSGETPQPDGAAGLRTLRIVLAAQESVRTGRTAEVG